jgi:hypothetical protein
MLRQLDVVAERYGVSLDRVRHLRWAAWQALQQKRQADAVRYYARAVGAGDIGSIGRAIVAALTPSYASRRARTDDPAREHDSWTIEARAWLEGLAGAATTPCE